MSLFGGGGAEREARMAREAEEARERRVQVGTEEIRNRFARAFLPSYYTGPQGLETQAKAVWQPQVESQYKQSMEQLQAALLRSGMYDSTAGAGKLAYAKQQKGVADMAVSERARGLSNQRKQDVAAAENTTIAALQASADPFAAAAQTSNMIAANSQMPEYSMMGQLFTDFTAGLATQADLERRGESRYNTGWFPQRQRGSSRYSTTVGG